MADFFFAIATAFQARINRSGGSQVYESIVSFSCYSTKSVLMLYIYMYALFHAVDAWCLRSRYNDRVVTLAPAHLLGARFFCSLLFRSSLLISSHFFFIFLPLGATQILTALQSPNVHPASPRKVLPSGRGCFALRVADFVTVGNL